MDLPSVVSFECVPPRVTLDSKDVIGAQTFVVVFKDYLCDLLKQPAETRPAMLKPGGPLNCLLDSSAVQRWPC